MKKFGAFNAAKLAVYFRPNLRFKTCQTCGLFSSKLAVYSENA